MKVCVTLLLFLSIAAAQDKQHDFTRCTIQARKASAIQIDKWYSCNGKIVRLTGSAEYAFSNGHEQNREFGMWWLGETTDLGGSPKEDVHFTNCTTLPKDTPRNAMVPVGGEANYAGYMSARETWYCEQGNPRLAGEWGTEIQGHWEYHLTLGEVDSDPMWIDDHYIQEFVLHSDFQKYCKTLYGYRLCGWIDHPKIDHGKPPLFKR